MQRKRRGARLTRREEGAYWAYATDEQRRRPSAAVTAQTAGRHGWAAIGAEGDACRAQAGCIAARRQREPSPRAVDHRRYSITLRRPVRRRRAPDRETHRLARPPRARARKRGAPGGAPLRHVASTAVTAPRSAVVVPHGMEHVDDAALGDRPARVDGVGRDDRHHARPEALGLVLDGQLELPVEHVRDLLVGVGVLGQLGPGRDGPGDRGHRDTVGEPAHEARHGLLAGHVGGSMVFT